MTWHWPQWTIAVCIALGMFCSVALNGKPKTGVNNGAATIIMLLVEVVILYFGGFWTPVP